jgi:hypothetical protein
MLSRASSHCLAKTALVVVALLLGGCLMAVIPQEAESRIVITSSRPDSLERVHRALAEFSTKYDYAVETPNYPPELAQTDYKARVGFFGQSAVSNASDRPRFLSVFRRSDGAVVITYQAETDVRATSNPVVNDLKSMIASHTSDAHVTYSYRPAHWRLTGMGD